MADEVKCIDGCGAVLSNPVRPEYTVKKTGHTIRPAARCGSCRAKYETVRCSDTDPRKGLKKVVTALLVSLSAVLFSGCAPYGPWPFSTEMQRRERLLYVDMTVQEVTQKKGQPIVSPNYNPAAAGYRAAALPPDFSGTAYYGIDGSISCEEVVFQAGKIVSVKYLRNPWAGYDTWSRHELTWDKQ